ncbi:MAG TPA: sugar ABC transporter ATP-binding protein [Chloroflexota bacterium]|nr:sugar ABC transporter ATP-binding protein [Chloroflexota bacterium]
MSLLVVRDLARRFGAVVALRSANLAVEPGEIHALLGANGAGKSTLVKILTGVIRPDSGTISLNDRVQDFHTPSQAQRAGIAAVFQDPALVPDLTLAENLRLTDVDATAVRRWLELMELAVDFGEIVADMPLAVLRMLDLARALAREPQILILDEITAALPSDLAERVFLVMREWRERGHAVLFITHRLREVRAVCDRATVLRDGHDVGTLIPSEAGEAAIVDLMLGPAAQGMPGQAAVVDRAAIGGGPRSDTLVLEARDISVGTEVHGVSLAIRAGEIVGVAALEGQGQEELFDALAGRRRRDAGQMLVEGRTLDPRTPFDAIHAGVVLVPADRVQALLPQRSVRENIALPLHNEVREWGPINVPKEGSRIGDAIRRLQIDTRAQRQARRLSGGNQQKVTIARWIANGFKALLLFDPTRGIDVGTKRQIHLLLRQLAGEGAAILFFTSELAEVQLACDRVLVMYEGRFVAEMPAADADEAALLHAMHGLVGTEGAA